VAQRYHKIRGTFGFKPRWLQDLAKLKRETLGRFDSKQEKRKRHEEPIG